MKGLNGTTADGSPLLRGAHPPAQAACAGTHDIRRRRIPSSGPGGRCRTGGAGDIRGSTAHRRPSPSRRGAASGATGSLVAEGDTPASEVVGGDGESHPVSREHADAEATHLSRDRGEHVVAVRQMNTKGRVG